MSTLQPRWLAIGAWVTVVTASALALMALGVSISGGAGVMLLAAAGIPSVVLMRIWRGAPPQTIAQVLYPITPGPLNEDQRAPATSRVGRS